MPWMEGESKDDNCSEEASLFREFAEPWERVYQLAAKAQGRDPDADAEIAWKNPERP